jgi:hypothetical protein
VPDCQQENNYTSCSSKIPHRWHYTALSGQGAAIALGKKVRIALAVFDRSFRNNPTITCPNGQV